MFFYPFHNGNCLSIVKDCSGKSYHTSMVLENFYTKFNENSSEINEAWLNCLETDLMAKDATYLLRRELRKNLKDSFNSIESKKRQILEFLQVVIDFFIHRGTDFRLKFVILHP